MLELFRLEFFLLAVETIGVLVFDSLSRFSSRMIESSAHAFLVFAAIFFLSKRRYLKKIIQNYLRIKATTRRRSC